MKPLFYKISLVAAGIAGGLILTEAGLRFYGVYFRHSKAAVAASAAAKAKILCVGDSFTFGMGAPKGSGYPSHLQEILDLKYGIGTYGVINEGIPGQNSSELADRIDLLLEEYKPEVLLILTGANNYNLRNSHFFLFAAGDITFPQKAALKTDAFLLRLKTYKFLKLGMKQLLSRINAGTYSAPPCSLAAKKFLVDFRSEFERHNFKRAASILDEGLRKDGECAELDFERGRMYFYFRDFPKAFSYFRRGRDLDPRHPFVNTFLSQERTLLHPEYAGRIMDKVLRHDLELICKAAARAGTLPLIQTYPVATDSQRDWIREEVSARAATAVINHHRSFLPLLSGGKLREYLSGDEPDLPSSHPNSAGYKLMAENIYETLKTLDLFKRQSARSAASR